MPKRLATSTFQDTQFLMCIMAKKGVSQLPTIIPFTPVDNRALLSCVSLLPTFIPFTTVGNRALLSKELVLLQKLNVPFLLNSSPLRPLLCPTGGTHMI